MQTAPSAHSSYFINWNHKCHKNGNQYFEFSTLFQIWLYLWAEGKDVRWWNAGSPKHLSLCWLWAIQRPCESAVSWNVSFLVAEVWLKPISDSTCIPFNLQEHEIQNKVSLVMEHCFRKVWAFGSCFQAQRKSPWIDL